MPDRPKPTSAPRLTWRQREAREIRAAVVDPQLVDPGKASPSVYQQDVLLVSPAAPPVFSLASRAVAGGEPPSSPLHDAAKRLGWTLEPEPLEDHRGDDVPDPRELLRLPGNADAVVDAPPRRSTGAAKTTRLRIGLDPNVGPEVPQVPPDAWRLLVEAKKAGATGLALNHIMTSDPFTGNPFTGNPFTGNPFTGNPFTGNPFTGNPFTGNAGGMAGYALPGFGGRQPVAYIGPKPAEAKLKDSQRPVVAIFDTGCGTHPWLANAVIDAVAEYGVGPLGIDDPQTDPDVFPEQDSVLDGMIATAAGHGTFIAGIVLQACPEARILPIRVADAQGVILENDLLAAVGRLVDLVEHGTRVDVVNMSFSYYHETPKEQAVNNELYDLLVRLRARGVVIVCSAGNDATDRPASPASLYHWDGSDCGIDPEGDIAPLITVGALNPSGDSVALFSNVGDWVETYVRGVSVLSTLPTSFQGGVQADISSDEYGRRRQTLDEDDFGDGFAVWSGTSFAAPLIAGRIAAVFADAAAKAADAADAAAAAATAKGGPTTPAGAPATPSGGPTTPATPDPVQAANDAWKAVRDTAAAQDHSVITP